MRSIRQRMRLENRVTPPTHTERRVKEERRVKRGFALVAVAVDSTLLAY